MWRWWPDGVNVVDPYKECPDLRELEYDEGPEPRDTGVYLKRDTGPLDEVGGVYWIRKVALYDLTLGMSDGDERNGEVQDTLK
jgi:hypothetical protein